MLVRLMPTEAPEGTIPRVILISDPGLNAYSFPDGAIYIHTGLLSQLENEAELALLLAHELAHVTGRHALRVLTASPAETDVTVFDRAESLAWFHDMAAPKELAYPSEELSSLRRSLEQEADRVGLDMVIKANYDPHEALEIFEHLREGDDKGTGVDRAGALLQALTPIDSVPVRLTDRRVSGNISSSCWAKPARATTRRGTRPCAAPAVWSGRAGHACGLPAGEMPKATQQAGILRGLAHAAKPSS
jgi:predicted Zn-dependent protease